ncbi:hypothetical protein ACU4GD_24400 [Cupriavidus basilensis]
MGTAHAGKCVSGNKTLYTDMALPRRAGKAQRWAATSHASARSRLRKLANQQFLQKRRSAEENEYQARIAREQAESVRTEVNQCHWLGNQIRQLDYDYSVRHARASARAGGLPQALSRRCATSQQARLRC